MPVLTLNERMSGNEPNEPEPKRMRVLGSNQVQVPITVERGWTQHQDRNLFNRIRSAARDVNPTGDEITLQWVHADGQREHPIAADNIETAIGNFEFDNQEDSIRYAWSESKDGNRSRDTGYVLVSAPRQKTVVPQQYFLDNPDNSHCVFQPVITWCNEQLKGNISLSTTRGYKAILNKSLKLADYYKQGVPEDKLQSVCDALRISIVLHKSIANKRNGVEPEIYESVQKWRKQFTFVNSRNDHIDLIYKRKINPELEMEKINITPEQVPDFLLKIALQGDNCPYMLKYDKKDANKISRIRTCEFDVTVETATTPFKNYLQELEKDVLKYCKIKMSSPHYRFIKEGATPSCSWVNPKYQFELESLAKSKTVTHIDQIKAYYSVTDSKYWVGIPTRMTDFRVTDTLQGEGYYMARNFKIPKRLKTVCQILHLFQNDGVYTKVELDFLLSHGGSFSLEAGCWGLCDKNFRFGEAGLEKVINEEGQRCGSFYALAVGTWMSETHYDTWIIPESSPRYADHLANDGHRTNYNEDDNSVILSIPFTNSRSLPQAAGYVYAYQRLNLLDQLMKFPDIENQLIAIYVDGIWMRDCDNVEVLDSFAHKKEKTLHKLSFSKTFSPRLNRDPIAISKRSTVEFGEYNPDWSRTERPHYPCSVYTGPGGTGKTHQALFDDGFLDVAYAAPTWRLLSNKRDELQPYLQSSLRKMKFTTVANLTQGNPQHQEPIKYAGVIVVDECSMLTENQRQQIMDEWSTSKIVFCGDVGYQAAPPGCTPENPEFKVTNVGYHYALSKQYRVKDEKLNKVLLDFRAVIQMMCKSAPVTTHGFQQITEEELKNRYQIDDIVIAFTNSTCDRITKMVKDKDKDQQKYVITGLGSPSGYTGDIIIQPRSDPKPIKGEICHCVTVHKYQGVTVKDLKPLYISEDVAQNARVAYTALSRAEYFSQIIIVTKS